jgi:hypothetical protein
MLELLLRILASSIVFAVFVPGVLVTLGGQNALYVHAVLFAVAHHFVAQLVGGVLGVPSKK